MSAFSFIVMLFDIHFLQEQMLMEPTMKGAISRMSVNSMSGIDLELPAELRNIQEFFLLMTICNTVVVSAHAHHDKVGVTDSLLYICDVR